MGKHLKRKYSLDERRDYYQAFKKSGMNHTEFCRVHGISRSALYAWSEEFQEGGNLNFSPLKLTQPEMQATKDNGMIPLEIHLANQVKFHMKLHKHQLISFIQELNHESAIIR